jgi:rRNA maturation endonuclease Nob1
MASWAAVAKTTAHASSNEDTIVRAGDKRVAVVDANAIINGVRMETVADAAVTIHEVLDEIRDKNSRQFLASLPFAISTREPSEESTKAGPIQLKWFFYQLDLTELDIWQLSVLLARQATSTHCLPST